jgi:hypothetical protein
LNALMKAAAGGKYGPHPDHPAVDLKLGLAVGQDDRELHRHIGTERRGRVQAGAHAAHIHHTGVSDGLAVDFGHSPRYLVALGSAGHSPPKILYSQGDDAHNFSTFNKNGKPFDKAARSDEKSPGKVISEQFLPKTENRKPS